MFKPRQGFVSRHDTPTIIVPHLIYLPLPNTIYTFVHCRCVLCYLLIRGHPGHKRLYGRLRPLLAQLCCSLFSFVLCFNPEVRTIRLEILFNRWHSRKKVEDEAIRMMPADVKNGNKIFIQISRTADRAATCHYLDITFREIARPAKES